MGEQRAGVGGGFTEQDRRRDPGAKAKWRQATSFASLGKRIDCVFAPDVCMRAVKIVIGGQCRITLLRRRDSGSERGVDRRVGGVPAGLHKSKNAWRGCVKRRGGGQLTARSSVLLVFAISWIWGVDPAWGLRVENAIFRSRRLGNFLLFFVCYEPGICHLSSDELFGSSGYWVQLDAVRMQNARRKGGCRLRGKNR